MPRIVLFLLILLFPGLVMAAQTLPSVKVKTAPVLDGSIQDQVWTSVTPVVITDAVAGVKILLRSVYTDDSVYFLIMFSDQAENAYHKPWIWDEAGKTYVDGPHREDTFVFKWNLEDKDVNLSNFSDDSYRADEWYWKANRSNPAGHADDKLQILSDKSTPKATETISPTGKKRYLQRLSDSGEPPYREVPRPSEFVGNLVNRYEAEVPTGSHADVRAKGVWEAGFWFIEVARNLRTEDKLDIQFAPESGKKYLFGVSVFSLYGNSPDESQPNRYGMGRISEPLTLEFR
jgi:hypothetical protein